MVASSEARARIRRNCPTVRLWITGLPPQPGRCGGYQWTFIPVRLLGELDSVNIYPCSLQRFRLVERGVDSARALRQCHSMSRDERWVLPLDPDCPELVHFMGSLEGRPEVVWDLFRDLVKDFERLHRDWCRRCQHFAVENGTLPLQPFR
jgi:hypothetical protein